MNCNWSKQDAMSPRLLLLYHVPKTGGSSVVQWLQDSMLLDSSRRPVDVVVRWALVDSFLGLHFRQLLDTAPAQHAIDCRDVQPQIGHSDRAVAGGAKHCIKAADSLYNTSGGLGWATSRRIALEFHSFSLSTFLRNVLPRMSALKAAYRQQCGNALSLTILREPISFVFSFYHMWPPRIDPLKRTHTCGKTLASMRACVVEPFPAYMHRTAQLQSKYYALRKRRSWVNPDFDLDLLRGRATGATHARAAAEDGRAATATADGSSNPPPARCNTHDGEDGAVATLQRFDAIGRTDRLSELLQVIATMRSMRVSPSRQRSTPLAAAPSTRGAEPRAEPQLAPRRVPTIRRRNLWPKGPSAAHYRQSQRWVWEALNSSAREALLEITRCDAWLFNVATRSRTLTVPV